jgi:hypothetical protein
MKKVSWWVKTGSFDEKKIYGELLGFVRGWFFTYAIVNPLEDCIGENLLWIQKKGHPEKVKLSEICIE